MTTGWSCKTQGMLGGGIHTGYPGWRQLRSAIKKHFIIGLLMTRNKKILSLIPKHILNPKHINLRHDD